MEHKVHEVTLEELLDRVDFHTDVAQIVSHVVDFYSIGNVLSFTPLLVGHEEFNCIVNTEKGEFVIKFLNKRKPLDIVKANVVAMVEFAKAGIPVPEMIENKEGKFLGILP